MKINYANISILLILPLLFSTCAIQKKTLNQADLNYAYSNAIKDAEIAETHEISKNLVAIVPSNKNLIWQLNNDDQDSSLLVVTWTKDSTYQKNIGQPVKAARDIWVTTVPEVKNFCKKLKGNKTLRLEQILGLPMDTTKRIFVEMWVRPEDLFRPSADPEISDSEAETDFRISNRFVKVSDEYKIWFNNLKLKSYAPGGYPWTRLGYTYDWGNKKNHLGLSEFVIMKGSTVIINSLLPTFQYCQ